MPKRALVNHRPWLLASIIAAIAFYFLRDDRIGELWLIPLKGASVGLLALYAFRRAPGKDGFLITLTMLLSALGDMAIVLSFEAGGALFFLSHCVAMALYLRNGREHASISQKALAVMLLVATPVISYFLGQNWAIGLYGLALGGMAATAWMSHFPRYRVGLGAVLFVVSDWLIFSQQSLLAGSHIPEQAIWPIYYLGQFMIATGVVQTLRHELMEEDG